MTNWIVFAYVPDVGGSLKLKPFHITNCISASDAGREAKARHGDKIDIVHIERAVVPSDLKESNS